MLTDTIYISALLLLCIESDSSLTQFTSALYYCYVLKVTSTLVFLNIYELKAKLPQFTLEFTY